MKGLEHPYIFNILNLRRKSRAVKNLSPTRKGVRLGIVEILVD